MIDWGSVLASVHAVFAEPTPVHYSVFPGAREVPVSIIWSDEPADPLQGLNGKARRLSAELRQSDVPERPTKTASLIRDGATYQVVDVTARDDIGAWVLFLKACA